MRIKDHKLATVLFALVVVVAAILLTIGLVDGKGGGQLTGLTAPATNSEAGPIWYYYGSEEMLAALETTPPDPANAVYHMYAVGDPDWVPLAEAGGAGGVVAGVATSPSEAGPIWYYYGSEDLQAFLADE